MQKNNPKITEWGVSWVTKNYVLFKSSNKKSSLKSKCRVNWAIANHVRSTVPTWSSIAKVKLLVFFEMCCGPQTKPVFVKLAKFLLSVKGFGLQTKNDEE